MKAKITLIQIWLTATRLLELPVMLKAHLNLRALSIGLIYFLSVAGLPAAISAASHDYPFQPVPFTAVHLNDAFWAPRLETNRLTTIPYAFGKCEESGRMYNFERAAAVLRGKKIADRNPPGFPFDDTDPYKILEGASYFPGGAVRPEDVGLSRQAHRAHRLGAGTRRLSLHDADD